VKNQGTFLTSSSDFSPKIGKGKIQNPNPNPKSEIEKICNPNRIRKPNLNTNPKIEKNLKSKPECKLENPKNLKSNPNPKPRFLGVRIGSNTESGQSDQKFELVQFKTVNWSILIF
jgi:hypothetical protein